MFRTAFIPEILNDLLLNHCQLWPDSKFQSFYDFILMVPIGSRLQNLPVIVLLLKITAGSRDFSDGG